MLWVFLLLAVSTVTSLECYVNFGVVKTCESPDNTPAQCATITTLQGNAEVACRSVLVCEFYADLVDEGIIADYKCCEEDKCNDPGQAPPATGAPGAVNATDPNDPVYRCSPYKIWPAWEGTAEECVNQYDGTECVFCAVANGNQIFQMCSPRFNYTCFEIENSHEVDDGYCSAGYACPAGTVVPSAFLFGAVGISFLFSLFNFL